MSCNLASRSKRFIRTLASNLAPSLKEDVMMPPKGGSATTTYGWIIALTDARPGSGTTFVTNNWAAAWCNATP